MDTKAEARDFLTSRRARITPEVPGLRREEVATLAGVSVDYYNRMERGNLAGVSDGVLAAVAGALRLDEAERAHLFDLARASGVRAGRRTPARRTVRPAVAWLVDAIGGAGAFAGNTLQDILAANPLGRAFYAPVLDSPGTPNMARFTYLDPRARDFFADW